MNVKDIISTLKSTYPGKTIVKNDDANPTEIICEIEPAAVHPDYSMAIAVIDQSVPHYHKISTETYEVLQGELTLRIDEKQIFLKEGDQFIVEPNVIHSARGKATTVRVSSKPGWTFEDHILV